jgi:hypothetical protein
LVLQSTAKSLIRLTAKAVVLQPSVYCLWYKACLSR